MKTQVIYVVKLSFSVLDGTFYSVCLVGVTVGYHEIFLALERPETR